MLPPGIGDHARGQSGGDVTGCRVGECALIGDQGCLAHRNSSTAHPLYALTGARVRCHVAAAPDRAWLSRRLPLHNHF
jgi:hypothetical protein